MVHLKIPSRLEYRDLAMRIVASACRLVPQVRDDFDDAVISAFGEALNNVVLHAYASTPGEIEITLEPREDALVIRLSDHGRSFDFDAVPMPDLDSLPEGGLGVFIIRSLMDDVSYAAGPPNVLSMIKFAQGRTKP